ncbi:hypothetical protein [Lachnotalea glycerini]|uniref:ATP-binding sugar transporter Gifsy-2 n=1 Tax=Lachnotalea glycerini TaxID=1763509 RepID=A0A371JC25_9FIRM|nr:hypothetical protein [Lachnotalea glycerini]RDY30295.1 hypothetical protein CG710_015280 [Lachnotalea glycerini]
MKSFKEQVNADIVGTFMNLEEFGTTHILDEKEVTLIIDDNELIERGKNSENYDGLYKKQVLIYVSAKDYGTLPRINKPICLDGKNYLVKSAIDEDGIYSIQMEANRA